jgi:hypothetical protein
MLASAAGCWLALMLPFVWRRPPVAQRALRREWAAAGAGRPGHVDLRRLGLHRRAEHERHQHRADLRRHAGGHRRGRRGCCTSACRAAQWLWRGARCWACCWSSPRATCATCWRCASPIGDGWIVAAAVSLDGLLGAAQALAFDRGGMLVLLPFTRRMGLVPTRPPLGWRARRPGTRPTGRGAAGRAELRRLFVPAARAGRGAHRADAVPGAGVRRRCWPGGCWARCPAGTTRWARR